MPWHYRKCATQVDYRVSWIGKVVERTLNIRDESVFTGFLKEDNGKFERRLVELCGGQDSSIKKLEDMALPNFPFVIFWTTTEEVEESLRMFKTNVTRKNGSVMCSSDYLGSIWGFFNRMRYTCFSINIALI